MKNVSVIFLACSFLFIQLGCKKDKITYTISGTVSDQTFNTTLNGTTVRLYITEAGTSTQKLIETVTTSSNGAYTFTFERGNYEDVTVKVDKENYFSQVKSFNLDDLSVEETNTQNFATKAKAWVNIHFVGDGSQSVSYFRSEGLSTCSECCPSGEFTLNNVTNVSIPCINNGNENYGIYYKNNGITNYIPVTVNTTAFDTTEMLINL